MPSTQANRLRKPAVVAVVALALPIAACTTGDDAGSYPTRSITMVGPWPAGSASDIAIRLISNYAEEELGHPITHQNMEGGSGATAWQYVHDAAPDGYTIGFFTSGVLANEALGQSPLSYQDFDWIMQFGVQSHGLYTTAGSGLETMDDIINAAEESPGSLLMGVESLGGNFHQGAGLFTNAAEVDVEFVPLGGSADLIAGLLGNHIDMMFNSITLPTQYVESGEMNFIAASSLERLPEFPDVPTFQELGFDVVHLGWRAVGVPEGTPDEAKQALADAFEAAYNNPEFQEAAAQADIELEFRNSEDFATFLDEQYPIAEEALRSIGLID